MISANGSSIFERKNETVAAHLQTHAAFATDSTARIDTLGSIYIGFIAFVIAAAHG